MNGPLAVLAFGAHPDDVELGCGGLLALCARRGQPAGAIDLTRGEGASRGTVEERAAEAERAAAILGLAVRENLGLPDLHLMDTAENRRLAAEAIRRHRPRLVLAPLPLDRHPDHAAVAAFVTAGAFLARMVNYACAGQPHAPAAVLYYLIHEHAEPSFIVDISEVWEVKRAAVAAYESQFDRTMPAGYRFAGTADYHAATLARAGYWGARIQRPQGEAYVSPTPLRVDDPVALLAG